MKIFRTSATAVLAAVTGAVFCVGSVALAESKPKGAKNADPQQVIQTYLGNTWEWSKGGSYWGGGGAFQAVWDNDPGDPNVSYTDGKWYVTSKGTLCYEAVWQWIGQDDPNDVTKLCWRHVVAPDGQMWRSDHEKTNDFHRVGTDNIKKGNQIKRTYIQYKKKVAG
jgi:hypothetical protein